MSTSSTQQALTQAIEVRRVRLGISKGELAERAGFSLSSLSKRMKGDLMINVNEVERIARALDLDPFDLIDLARAERTTEPAAA